MKYRKLFVVAPIIAGIVMMAVFAFIMSRSAFAGNFFAFSNNQSAQASHDGTTILARRLISIPFGIQDSLALSDDGQVVTVQGHGDCPAGGQDFQLKVTVSQDSLNGLAVGHTTGQCVSGGRALWEVAVRTPDSKAFTPGDALACGHVIVHTRGGGDVVGDWCKNVTLQ
jgi:hypothetical protein